jgi:hypothetical protein
MSSKNFNGISGDFRELPHIFENRSFGYPYPASPLHNALDINSKVVTFEYYDNCNCTIK